MRTAPVTDLKNRLSHYLRLVARGESVTVMDRGRAVAQITRIVSDDAEVERLTANGLARPPRRALPADFTRRRIPRAKRSVSEALDAEREDRF